MALYDHINNFAIPHSLIILDTKKYEQQIADHLWKTGKIYLHAKKSVWYLKEHPFVKLSQRETCIGIEVVVYFI